MLLFSTSTICNLFVFVCSIRLPDRDAVWVLNNPSDGTQVCLHWASFLFGFVTDASPD
jgi:hypothetical protein